MATTIESMLMRVPWCLPTPDPEGSLLTTMPLTIVPHCLFRCLTQDFIHMGDVFTKCSISGILLPIHLLFGSRILTARTEWYISRYGIRFRASMLSGSSVPPSCPVGVASCLQKDGNLELGRNPSNDILSHKQWRCSIRLSRFEFVTFSWRVSPRLQQRRQ